MHKVGMMGPTYSYIFMLLLITGHSLMQNKSIGWVKYVYVGEIGLRAEGIFESFPSGYSD